MAKQMRIPQVGTKLWAVKAKSFDDEKHTMTIVANSGQVDRVGEILDPAGCDWSEFMLNPVFLWVHDDEQFPIGRVNRIWAEPDEGILEEVQFAVNEYEKAATAWSLYRGGYLNAASVRFMADEWEDFALDSDEFRQTGCLRRWTSWKILETSGVNVPCDALALRKALDSDPAELRRLLKDATIIKATPNLELEGGDGAGDKAVVPFKEFPLADEDTRWGFGAADGNAIIEKGGWKLYKQVHTWQDPEIDPETRQAYKLPHHKIVDGSVKTVWRGAAAAMAIVLGARGGIDISDAGRRSCHGHLAKEYKRFDKPVPDFKQYGPTDAALAAFGIDGAGELVKILEPYVRKGVELDLEGDGLLAILGGWYDEEEAKSQPDAAGGYIFGPEVDGVFVEALEQLKALYGDGGKDPEPVV